MAVMRMSLNDAHFSGKRQQQKTEVKRENSFSSIQPKPVYTRQTQVSTNTAKAPGSWKFVGILLLVAFIGYLIAPTVTAAFANLKNTVNTVAPIIPALNPELQKDENGKTNVLLVGIDTRETGPLELSTDTIILASYDHTTHRVAMVSFPRDLALTYPTTGYVGRINGLYASAENKTVGTGLETLKKEIESITTQKIHYYAMVNLKGFVDAIDTIGGIDVYLETDISGQYPTENLKFISVSFKKGWNHMNGTQALQYARLRKNVIPYEEGNDFARARRQQKVIQAVIDKATKTETLLDAKTLYSLFSVASKNVKTSKFSLEDVQAGATLLKEEGKPEMFTYVLDFYAGGEVGRLIDVINTNPYLLGPRLGLDKWGEIQQFTKEYIAEPLLPTMEKKIRIYNAAEVEFSAKYSALTKRFYFAPIEKGGEAPAELAGKVYVVGGKRYEPVAQFFAKLLGIQYATDAPEMFQSGDWSEVAVVIIL